MIIVREKQFIPELKTKFKVVKVDWEPHVESQWYLQYKNLLSFHANEQLCETKEEDEKLAGKEIEAHIKLSVYKSKIINKTKKAMMCQGNYITATGFIEDDIKRYYEGKDGELKEFIRYKLNSIFPLELSDAPKGTKIGDWVTVEGEAVIYFPESRSIMEQP